MADFSFTVDTTPMARSVDSSKGHINAVTGAVVAMETAVIAAEKKASQTICDNVDNGFYMLVRSQISQKAVAAYTEMTSKQMTLLQLAKALDGVKRQMEGDFNMITKRYAKLFNSLNKALETRVKELDRPAMQLAEIKKKVVFDKLKDDSSMLLSISAETLPLTQTALSGKLKQKTRDAMTTLAQSLIENRSYNEKLDSILVKSEGSVGDSDYQYLPSIFISMDSLLKSGDAIENIYTADVWLPPVPITSEVSRVHSDLQWSEIEKEDKDAIRREFLALCEKEGGEERLANEIIRLFDAASWEVLNK
jgi:hypothetical protein